MVLLLVGVIGVMVFGVVVMVVGVVMVIGVGSSDGGDECGEYSISCVMSVGSMVVLVL